MHVTDMRSFLSRNNVRQFFFLSPIKVEDLSKHAIKVDEFSNTPGWERKKTAVTRQLFVIQDIIHLSKNLKNYKSL